MSAGSFSAELLALLMSFSFLVELESLKRCFKYFWQIVRDVNPRERFMKISIR